MAKPDTDVNTWVALAGAASALLVTFGGGIAWFFRHRSGDREAAVSAKRTLSQSEAEYREDLSGRLKIVEDELADSRIKHVACEEQRLADRRIFDERLFHLTCGMNELRRRLQLQESRNAQPSLQLDKG